MSGAPSDNVPFNQWVDIPGTDQKTCVVRFRLQNLEEHVVLEQFLLPKLGELPSNVQGIVDYVFTEMLNNAIDHSEGKEVTVFLDLRNDNIIRIHITDDGIGIFENIQRELQLENKHDAIIELCKGGLTTDPERHTGEGIFFTSRACNLFLITRCAS